MGMEYVAPLAFNDTSERTAAASHAAGLICMSAEVDAFHMILCDHSSRERAGNSEKASSIGFA